MGVYADSGLPTAEAQALTDNQAARLVTELRSRDVDGWQISARGYGTAEASRSGRGGVVFTILQQSTGGGDCVDTSTSSHALTGGGGEDGSNLDGSFSREVRDCDANAWRIVSGTARHMSSDNGIGQSMLNLSVRKERLVGNDRIRGRFLGVYGTKSGVSGVASGTILGFGVNGGLYGAKRMIEDMYFDYYLGLAAGRHGFDLAFDRMGGVVDAQGHYTYGAVFAGAPISGEARLKGLSLTPRAGLEVAWSPGGNGDLTVTRGLLKEAGSVTVPQVIGMRLFASVRVEDLLPASNALLSLTPGLFCDRGFEERSTDCGISARVELSSDNEESDRHYAIAIDLEGTAETVSTGVELSYRQMLGEGKVEGGVTFRSSGDAGLTGQYELEF